MLTDGLRAWEELRHTPKHMRPSFFFLPGPRVEDDAFTLSPGQWPETQSFSATGLLNTDSPMPSDLNPDAPDKRHEPSVSDV